MHCRIGKMHVFTRYGYADVSRFVVTADDSVAPILNEPLLATTAHGSAVPALATLESTLGPTAGTLVGAHE